MFFELSSMTSFEFEFNFEFCRDFKACNGEGEPNDRVDGCFSRSLDGPSNSSSFTIPFISSR
jgi:hypothetical protein